MENWCGSNIVLEKKGEGTLKVNTLINELLIIIFLLNYLVWPVLETNSGPVLSNGGTETSASSQIIKLLIGVNWNVN